MVSNMGFIDNIKDLSVSIELQKQILVEEKEILMRELRINEIKQHLYASLNSKHYNCCIDDDSKWLIKYFESEGFVITRSDPDRTLYRISWE